MKENDLKISDINIASSFISKSDLILNSLSDELKWWIKSNGAELAEFLSGGFLCREHKKSCAGTKNL